MNHTEETMGGTSASNAPADRKCAGRHQAQIGLPDVTTEDASFGTAIHDALVADDPSKLQPDQLSVFEGCIEIREKLIAEKFGLDAPKAERIKEQRFWWRSEDGKMIHSAKVDLVVKHNDEALIVEYKTLTGTVENAAENEQLRDQVALCAGNLKLNEVDVAVVQPLVTYSPLVCRYDLTTIAKSAEEMIERVKASNAPNAPRTAGTVQCKHCRARFTCKEYSKFVALAVPQAMSSLAVPVQQWSPEQRALFCERFPVAMKWLEECKKAIKEGIKKDPEYVPGYRLSKPTILRPINNPNELHTRFLALGGTTEQFMACVQISKGELENQVRVTTKLKGKGLKAKLDEVLAGIVEEKPNEPSLEEVK